MFILTKIADLVQIKPGDFRKESFQAIEDNINEKYANKVIQKIGLCIGLYDLLWASEGFIGHGTGTANVNVEFRLIVFRPFKGEVIQGRISRCTPDGIYIRTDFFDDIFIEKDELPDGCVFSHTDNLWTMDNDGALMYFDLHEVCRFTVIGEEWHDQTPTKPVAVGELEEKLPPYKIKGSMKGTGLGCTLWWEF